MAKVSIQEVRKLLLPMETAVDAILELDRSHGGTLASGRLTEVRLETGDDPGLLLVLTPGSGKPAVEKRYTLAAIAAAAIHYCFRARIPLPRQGTKSIEIVPEGFQLTIQTQTEILRLHGPVPQVTVASESGAAEAPGASDEMAAAATDPVATAAAEASPTVAPGEAPEAAAA